MKTRISSEVGQVVQDAERYRFLRENWLAVDVERPEGPHRLIIGSDDLDAMIDRYQREDRARPAGPSQEAPAQDAAA